MVEHYKSLTDIIKTLDEMIAECHGADYNGLFKARNAIAALPDADVKPVVRGEWIYLYDGNYKCSECGEWYSVDVTPIEAGMFYCPNCGSYNGGETDGET